MHGGQYHIKSHVEFPRVNTGRRREFLTAEREREIQLECLCGDGASLPLDGTAVAFVILVLYNFGARASVAAQEDRGNKRSHPALKLLLNKCVHAMRGKLSRWQRVKVV